ncbi:MAG: lytic murein transglycosylase [bacterium]|nr:lytic murein transglycosylase [Candidatus Kapabacteria bacterium]
MTKSLAPLLLVCLFFNCALTGAQTPQALPDQPTEPVRENIATAAGDTFSIERPLNVSRRYEPIVQKLIDRGFPERWVRERFADRRTVFIPKLARVSPRKKSTGNAEPSSAYRWVNTEESARACRAFITTYRDVLDSASRRFGVEPEMIAALMRTETQHGKITGDYHVFSVFASTALLTQPDVLSDNITNGFATLKERNADSAEMREQAQYIRARSKKKADWAIDELASLLKIERDGRLDAMSIYGSWAGAFGWSQFLPSSYLRRAVDGNGDAKVDLFTPADAIHSVANYLKAAGYVRGNNRRARKALFNYNNSTPYVTSIMGLAARVKRTQQ